MGLMDRVKRFLQSAPLDVKERFELLREAVSGTMSKFYVVRDRNTGTIYGLKILDPEKTGAFESRFAGLQKPSEGEIAIRFDHPRIVRTFECGKTTSGEHFLLMEYLTGPGLNALIRIHDPALDQHRLQLIRQMAEALHAVHSAGFIHRDICPRNFICAADASSLKLIDFGLTVPAQKEYMQGGNRTGTPNYMAPEIVRRRPTDQRLDIFALGVTCFQLCALELPWPSLDASGKAAVLHDTRKPADLLALRPDTNPTLAELIHRSIARDPADRPVTAEHFLRLLDRVPPEDSQ
jgi:serine/threonine-protein kinase